MFHSFHESVFNYVFPNLGRHASWTPPTPKQLAVSPSLPGLIYNTALSPLWLAFRMEKVFLDTRWMQGEEFSKIYFCLNPIHLLGTRQGKLFPWHRVCLRVRVGPSRALSLLPVLLRINGSTWSPNPLLHSVPFSFLSLLFPPLPFLSPCPPSLVLQMAMAGLQGLCAFLCETNSSPRRGLLNPHHSVSLFLLFCKMC